MSGAAAAPPADATEAEAAVNAYFADVVAEGSPRRFLLRHPVRSARARTALRRLPRLVAELPDEGEARGIRLHLWRPPLSRWTTEGATGVLPVPSTPEEYRLGASKQTLRRKVRAAEKAGVTWRRIDDPGERQRLLDFVERYEREQAPADYRVTLPVLDDLPDYALWLAAFSREGAPLLLSVTPVHGDWALLRYFRSLADTDDASTARYLMTQVLVDHLVAAKVRWLADSVSPLRLTNGLRHFQRMVGFRLARIELRAPRGR
jgi:hypothetical protein